MTGSTDRKISIASAAPRPTLMLLNACWNMSLASTWVSNCPFVTTFTMSNTFITKTISVVTTTPMVVPICGNVTRQKTWLSVAPSILAASISSVGTALIAAERITIENPTWIQIRITINQKLLYGLSWTNTIVWPTVSPSSVILKPPIPPPTIWVYLTKIHPAKINKMAGTAARPYA